MASAAPCQLSEPGTPEVFETTDLAYAEEILSASYADLRITVREQHGGISIIREALGPSVRLDHLRFAMSYDLTGTPLDVLTVGQLRAGQTTYRSDHSERRCAPGDVFFGVQPGHTYSAISENADIEVTVLDPVLVGQVAGTTPGRTSLPIRFTGYRPVTPEAAQAWKNTCAYVRETVLDNPRATGQPLVAGAASRLLAATVLATFPNTALSDPTIEDRHDAHDQTLRRAITFIDEHAHQDITVAGIAEAARVTIRAVQLAFRRRLDVTPMEYLRQVRLGHAHQDLLAASPASTSVTTVAYRWGFASSSRFAASYRRAYGVTPSQTLRRD